MKIRSLVPVVVSFILAAMPAAPVAAEEVDAARVVLPTDRTVLPIPEPQYPHSTVFDARNATISAESAHRAIHGASNRIKPNPTKSNQCQQNMMIVAGAACACHAIRLSSTFYSKSMFA